MRRGVSLSSCWLAALLAMASLAVHAARPYALLHQSAPDFALRAVAGENVRLSEHRGEVVILTFWSSRCAPCGEQLAALERTWRTYGAAGLKVFGVNVEEDRTRAVHFAGSQSVDFPLLLDPDRDVSRRYRIDSLPTTILIDRSGAIRHMHRDHGEAAQGRYLPALRALLNE